MIELNIPELLIGLIISVIGSILVLLIEYWIVQPIKSGELFGQPVKSTERPQVKTGKLRLLWQIALTILSLGLPAYIIFAGSILLVNMVSKNPATVVYGSVTFSSILGIVWGVIWTKHTQKPSISNNNSRQVTSKRQHSGKAKSARE